MTSTRLWRCGAVSSKRARVFFFRFIAALAQSIPVFVITPAPGAIAVIFLSGRSAAGSDSYEVASAAMGCAAQLRDGYLGIDAVRGDDGVGVTISWWRDEASALGWRDDPDHARIREQGRALWYDWYRVIVATVDRAYEWQRTG